ncbi:hypothetical protein PFY12_00125 [Chryseobacterium camelliae]|uniref:Uncharacterized protein n=1 Tax=Chryseobacterium camelliae TaxID=1265445 RepID=A0ABY7QLK2_9FLAO|nr:hypothetical protein [Chryseobacterium camelliae]WBV60540.1 hypothetical protein PFY12_00125 [Chryseobacterium camelliae]
MSYTEEEAKIKIGEHLIKHIDSFNDKDCHYKIIDSRYKVKKINAQSCKLEYELEYELLNKQNILFLAIYAFDGEKLNKPEYQILTLFDEYNQALLEATPKFIKYLYKIDEEFILEVFINKEPNKDFSSDNM